LDTWGDYVNPDDLYKHATGTDWAWLREVCQWSKEARDLSSAVTATMPPASRPSPDELPGTEPAAKVSPNGVQKYSASRVMELVEQQVKDDEAKGHDPSENRRRTY
jgi:hypothetical protein